MDPPKLAPIDVGAQKASGAVLHADTGRTKQLAAEMRDFERAMAAIRQVIEPA